MNRIKLAKMIMTIVLMAGAISSFMLDWTPNHLLNPAWHPHARFHGALLLFFLGGVSTMGIWLLWHESKKPELAVKVATFISFSFWTPLILYPVCTPVCDVVGWGAGKRTSNDGPDSLSEPAGSRLFFTTYVRLLLDQPCYSQQAAK
jgi:hypothetical protein